MHRIRSSSVRTVSKLFLLSSIESNLIILRTKKTKNDYFHDFR